MTDRHPRARAWLWAAIPVAILLGDIAFRARFHPMEELSKSAWSNWPMSVGLSAVAWAAIAALLQPLGPRVRAALSAVVALPAAFFVSAMWQYNNVIQHDPNAGVVAYAVLEPANTVTLASAGMTLGYVAALAALVALFFSAVYFSELRVSDVLRRAAILPVLGYLLAMVGWHDPNPSQESFYASDIGTGVIFAHAGRRLAESGDWAMLSQANRPAVAVERNQDELPDVLLFIGESLRHRQMSAYGYARATTPRIDALAAADPEGFVRFDHAYAPSAITVTALLGILSGMYAGNARDDVHQVPTLWQYAQALGGESDLVASQMWSWSNMSVHFFTSAPPTRWQTADELRLPIVNDTGVDDRVAAKVMARQMDGAAHSNPWLGIFQANATHFPFLASENAGFELATNEDRYDAAVVTTDEAFGIVVDGLKAAGMSDDTIIIFTSDHGEFSFAQHAPPEGQQIATDHVNGGRIESCHPSVAEVPFFVYVPPKWRVRLGDRFTNLLANRQQVVSNVDIMPTILGLWDVPTPDHLDGRNALQPIPADRHALCFTAASWVTWYMQGLAVFDRDHFVYLREDFDSLQSFPRQDPSYAAKELRGVPPSEVTRAWYQSMRESDPLVAAAIERVNAQRP